MNLASLRSELRELIGDPSKAEVDDERLQRYLLSAAEWLASELRAFIRTDEQSLALVANQQEYLLPTDVEWLLWIEYNGDRLTPASTNLWVRDSTDWRGETAGTPTEFAVEGRNLILRPKPSAAAIVTDAALSYRYMSSAPSLTASGAPGLSDLDQRLALYEAALEYAGTHPSEENAARAQFYGQQIARLLPAAKARAENRLENYIPEFTVHTSRRGGGR